MKKQLLKLKMLLVAAALCVGASAWATPTTIYGRAITADLENGYTAWSAADVAVSGTDLYKWIGNFSFNETYGLYQKGTGGRSAVMTFEHTDNTLQTFDIVYNNLGNTGNAGNYSYIRIGNDIEIQSNQQNQNGTVIINGNSSSISNCNVKNYNRGGDSWTIHIEINTAKKTVTALTIVGTEMNGKSASYTLSSETALNASATFNTVTIGFTRAAGTPATALTSIKISEEAVTNVGYTVNYKLGEETVKTVSTTSVVGAEITADVAVDGEGTYEGNHYLITAADAPSMTLVADAASNVLNVPVRAPYTATLNVTRNIGGEDQTPVVKNLTETDAKVCAWTYTYPMYVQKDGIYYVADETASFGESGVFTDGQVINKTVKYTNPDYSVVYFGEPNETEGTNTTYSNGSTGFITGGVVFSDNRVIRLGTLPAGEYHLITNVVGDANRNVVVGDCSDTSVFPTALVTITSTGAYDETFTLDAATPISISGKQQSDTKFNQSATVDYILVKASVQKATIAGSGFSTIASAYALDCANLPSGLTAYKVTTVGASNVALEEVTEAVAAGTGLILKGTAEETYNIPVVASGTDISATNKLQAAVADTPVEANEAYILKGGEFCKVTAASTVPAGKAYLLASDVPASARALDIVIGETTGINAAQLNNEVLNGEFFNLQGQRVAAPTKGLYIVNGKKVIIK